MISYKKLYYGLVRDMDEALTCFDNGDTLRARMTIEKALVHAEDAISEYDIIPDQLPQEFEK